MAEKDWRVLKMCKDCPFQKSGAGLRQRKALRPERWREIKRGLLQGLHFFCHKTASGDEDDNGNYDVTGREKYCAGAIAFENKHHVSSNYRRVCESLDYFAAQREKKKKEPISRRSR